MRRLCLECWVATGARVPVNIAGEGRCDECLQREAERVNEERYHAWHGGNGPFNDRERESVR